MMRSESPSANPDRLIIGCGYLGRRVAQRMLPARVFAVTRSHSEELRQLGLLPIVADVLDRSSLRNLPDVAVVVYAVGFDRSAGKSMREVYVDGLTQVLDALAPTARLIYVSSTSVYGQVDGSEVDESGLCEPRDDSGRIVLAAETKLRLRRPDAIILRLGGIYGPGRLLRRAASLRAGEPIAGNPDAWLNLIHVDDAATAVLASIERGAPGATYNVVDDCPVRRRDYYGCLAKLLDALPPTFVEGSERNNRRIGNRRMKSELHVVLRYSSYVEGLRHALAEEFSN